MEELDAGDFIGHFPCIADEFPTKANGHTRKHCNSSDACAVYRHTDLDGSVWYDAMCWSCHQTFTKEEVHSSSIAASLGIDSDGVVKEPKKFDSVVTKKERITREELADLWNKTGGKDGNSGKGYRGLSDWVLKFYGHRIEYNAIGDVKAVYYPETRDGKLWGYKPRVLPKIFGIGNLGCTGLSSELSGQYKFPDGGRYVLIVGGEEDKCAAQDMLRDYQKQKGQADYEPYAVVSPTTGEPSAWKQCRTQYEWFDKFDVIVVGMDNDDAGIAAMEEIIKVLPKDKIRVAKWSGKDPNKMLLDGNKKQFISDFFSAKEIVDTGVYNADDDMLEDVIDVLTTPRIPLPPFAKKLQDMTKGSGLFTRSIYSIVGDTSVGKCESKDTPILMSDASLKMVQDIKVGDKVMGSDGSPRTVINTHSGVGMMYKVTQVDGMSYTVNKNHVLSLRAGYNTKDPMHGRKCSVDYKKGQIVNISVEDYLNLPAQARRSLKGYKADLKNLGEGKDHVFEPYILGVWLGDGTTMKPQITCAKKDVEILEEIKSFVERNNYRLNVSKSNDRKTVISYDIYDGYRTFLSSKNLIGNKHIPYEYLTACYEDRIELLSGLLDTDGYKTSGGYEITQKSEKLAEDIQFLAKSLGLTCSLKVTMKGVTGSGVKNVYYRMHIYGDVSKLKLRLSRKQIKRDELSDLRFERNTAIKVTPVGVDNYYGIEIDGDHLYCLGDFTVTHNSTFIDAWVYYWMMNLKDHKVGIVSIEATKGEWVAGMLSTYLAKNLWWIPQDQIREYMDTPEVKDKIHNFFHNEYGESRFAIVDDREGTVASLQKCMERLERQYGCSIIVVDVLTDILRVVDNEEQAKHFNWQSNFVKNGATIFNVLHTRKQGDNRGGRPTFPSEYDAYGNSIFVQKAAGNFVIARNKEAPNGDIIEQNTTYLRVPKLRKGETGNGGEWYYDGETRAVYDRDEYFKDHPEKLPVGYDLTINSFDRAYWEEGGRGWDGVSSGGKSKKQPSQKEYVPDFVDIDGIKL